jgi:small ligand-binding sensory domain FIST
MNTVVAPRFAAAHAMHPDWRMALSLVLAQLDPIAPPAPTLGWCYLSDRHAAHADDLLAALRERWPGCAWVGAVGVGVCASGVEYFDEPGLVLMLSDLAPARFRVFSGREPLSVEPGFVPHAAQVHADPATLDLPELLTELAERTSSGYLFGGLASSRARTVTLADGVFEGGLSGVAFDASVAMLSRVTQGCQPVGPSRLITEVERNVVFALDDQPALNLLFADLGVSEAQPREALRALRQTWAGVSDRGSRAITHPGQFGREVRVRHLVGIDPSRRGIAIADVAEPGQQLAFCRRDVEAARRDLVRIAAEIRSELEPEELELTTGVSGGARRIVGALYASCTGRGGPHFGGPSAELAILRHALGGDVPLAGFFAAGEIGHHHLYGYTGVLTVFTAPA